MPVVSSECQEIFAIENLPRGERGKIALPPAEKKIFGEGIFTVTHCWRSSHGLLKHPRVERIVREPLAQLKQLR